MIDEKLLTKDIHAYFHAMIDRMHGTEIDKDVLTLNKDICGIIERQPKADWIPYTTNGELPCNGQKVWLSFTNEVCSYVKQAFWNCDHFEWDNGKRVKDYPTAWRPFIIPQPYKKEGAE